MILPTRFVYISLNNLFIIIIKWSTKIKKNEKLSFFFVQFLFIKASSKQTNWQQLFLALLILQERQSFNGFKRQLIGCGPTAESNTREASGRKVLLPYGNISQTSSWQFADQFMVSKSCISFTDVFILILPKIFKKTKSKSIELKITHNRIGAIFPSCFAELHQIPFS